MPYDPKNDPYASNGSDRLSFGRKGVTIVASDTVDLASYAKAIVVLSAGDVVLLPSGNDDAATLKFEGMSAGQIVPFQVRRVLATGTTAKIAAIMD